MLWFLLMGAGTLGVGGLGPDVLLRQMRFVMPLLVGIIVIVVMGLPLAEKRKRASANLVRRTPITYVDTAWAIALGVLVLVAATAAVVAGAASSPDESGRLTRYQVVVEGVVASTEIYGWYYSVPCLLAIVGLLLVTLLGVAAVARPPLADDPDLDETRRRARSGILIRMASGSVLLHLAFVLQSLAGTASLGGSTGGVTMGTPFAAFGPTMLVASYVAATAGFTLWTTSALAVIPSPRAARK
jgi:hypothetical protein